ncbi:non-specific lipid-transfer protein 2-like [Impatiens glandulifera]|uniref:non-specific lipid-transfer protein 2-like n=1 Tax=Impatiens glandulifera TaxID=253017 RepID=UPI001FB18CD0|nr:non-specific lipid-transfer protein 2-like [Impatiens glandulifera]
MKSFSIFLTAVVVVVVVAVALAGEVAEANVTCNLLELSPCLGAINSPKVNPTKECCAKLIEQQLCLCRFPLNPAYKPYIDSPNARPIFAACRIPFPKCFIPKSIN